jgi:hypothetical protein
MQPIVHSLKSWPEFFSAVLDGWKTFEVRRDDRGFAVGDELLLREFEPSSGTFTGRTLRVRVTYVAVLTRVGLPGFVGMSIERED